MKASSKIRHIMPFYWCLFVLTGCINTDQLPNTQYYLLDDPLLDKFTFTLPSSDQKDRKVRVNLVNVADFLSQPNLVMKLDNHQIAIANYHIWGEDLPSSIQRVILKDLNEKYENTMFLERCLNCLELSIYIDHFYPTQAGKTILSGSYELAYDMNDIERKEFLFSAAQDTSGYVQSVKNMRMLLQALADSIEVGK